MSNRGSEILANFHHSLSVQGGIQLLRNMKHKAQTSTRISQRDIELGWESFLEEISKIKDDAKRSLVMDTASQVADCFCGEAYLAEAAKAFVDAAGDSGNLDVQSFSELVVPALSEIGDQPVKQADVVEIFKCFDANDNGSVDVDEYQVFLSYVALFLCVRMADDAGHRFDSQNPKKITQMDMEESWKTFMRQLEDIEDKVKKEVAMATAIRVSSAFASDDFLAQAAASFKNACGSKSEDEWGDGFLTVSQFAELVVPTVSAIAKKSVHPEDVIRIFKTFDADGSGTCNAEEYKVFLSYIALYVCATVADEALENFEDVKAKSKVTMKDIEEGWETLIKTLAEISDEEMRASVVQTTQSAADAFASKDYLLEAKAAFVDAAGESRVLGVQAFAELVVPALSKITGKTLDEQEVIHVFTMFDADGSADVDVEEYQVFLNYLALYVCAMVANEAGAGYANENLPLPDLKGSSKVTFKDVTAGWEQLHSQISSIEDPAKRKVVADTAQKVADAFSSQEYLKEVVGNLKEKAGPDGDIPLATFNEFVKPTLEEISGMSLSDKDMERVFQSFDVDGSGSMDVAEYQTLISYIALYVCAKMSTEAGILFETQLPFPLDPITQSAPGKMTMDDINKGWTKLLAGISSIENEAKKEKVLAEVSKVADSFRDPEYLRISGEAFDQHAGTGEQLTSDKFAKLILPLVSTVAERELSKDDVLRVFKTFDTDRSGSIDREEFSVFISYIAMYMCALVADEAGYQFDTTLPLPDFAQVNKVTKDMMAEAWELLLAEIQKIDNPLKKDAVYSQVKAAWDYFDTEEFSQNSAELFVSKQQARKDGTKALTLTYSEFSDIATVLVKEITGMEVGGQLEGIFEAFDADGNGSVDLEEYETFISYLTLDLLSQVAENAGAAFDAELVPGMRARGSSKQKASAPQQQPSKITAKMMEGAWSHFNEEIKKIEDQAKRDYIVKECTKCQVDLSSQSTVAAIIDLFKVADSDHNKVLTLDEFVAVAVVMAKGLTGVDANAEDIIEVFNTFDADGNGTLDKEEYEIFVSYLALDLMATVAEEAGAAFDEKKPVPGMRPPARRSKRSKRRRSRDPPLDLEDNVEDAPKKAKRADEEAKAAAEEDPFKGKITNESVTAAWTEFEKALLTISNPEKKDLICAHLEKATQLFTSESFMEFSSDAFQQKAQGADVLTPDQFCDLAMPMLRDVLNQEISRKDVMRVCHALDTNSDGVMDIQEYVVFLQYYTLEFCIAVAEDAGLTFDKISRPPPPGKISSLTLNNGWAGLVQSIEAMQSEEHRTLLEWMCDRMTTSLLSDEFVEQAAQSFIARCGPDGCLSLPQFIDLTEPLIEDVMGYPIPTDDIKEMFDHFDADGSTAIDPEEYETFLAYVAYLVCVMTALHLGMSKEDATRGFEGPIPDFVLTRKDAPRFLPDHKPSSPFIHKSKPKKSAPDLKDDPHMARVLEFDASRSLVTDDQLWSKWEEYDVKGNGWLEKKDFVLMYKSIEDYGLPISDSQIDEMLNRYNVLGDGKVSYDEFCIMMLKRVNF